MRARWALALGIAALAGCAGATRAPVVASTSAGDARTEEAARVSALAVDEQKALGAVATLDPRFARRYGQPVDDEARATLFRAILGTASDAPMHDGALDLFEFAARARGLDEAARIVARSPAPSSDADGAIARPRLERELLERVVVEERARVDEERDLPRGASALVRGVVETWTTPDAKDGAGDRDVWLAKRLDEVGASLGGAKLSRTELIELDDALDPLERLAEGLPETAKALARLRVALGNTTPATSDDATSWQRVAASLRAHLGLAPSPTDLRERLERAEKALRADAVALLARAGTDERAIARLAEQLLFAPGACGADAARSRVRALAPPPERAAICGGLAALHAATDDNARAAAVVVLHDEAVVAIWALGLHADHLRPEKATQLAHPFFGVPLDREARLVRIAAARPVAAIGAGLAAELLARDPEAGERWYAFGDAPLDVVERELFATASRPPPVSLRP